MNKFKRLLSVVLCLLMSFSCFSFVACNKEPEKPKKTTMTVTFEKTEVEVGDIIPLPAPVVIDKDGADISATSEYYVTVTDPKGEDAFVDESGAVKQLEILLIGDYKITYKLLDDETVSFETMLTAKDTVAPVIKDILDYKTDLFKGETFTLPRPISEDASGIDVSKTKLTVTANKDDSLVELDEKKSFVVNDLEGYTLHISLTDNNGLEKTYNYPIRVTEKWLDEAHLQGRELLSFSQAEYLNNIKKCDIRDMDYALTEEAPAANKDNGIGSSDGKTLKVTLPEGAIRERRWLRVWLPKPVERGFGSLKMKLWFNNCIDSIWWHNRDIDDDNAIAAWSAGKDYTVADMVADRWNVVEVQECHFSDELYPEKIEYLDFAFWLKNSDEVVPEIYIDEIFFDTVGTTFVDNEVVDGDVLADFNEIGQNDYMGNPATVGYEETIKVRGNVDRTVTYPLGSVRALIDFVDRGATELGGDGNKTGDKALKVTPKIHSSGAVLDTNFFFMFPKTFEYNENYFIEMDIYIPNVEYSVLVRSYSENMPYFAVKTAVEGVNDVPLKANAWNTIRIPMKNFAGDLTAHGNGGMFIQLYDALAADGKSEAAPAYIDNIVVSKYALQPKEVVLEDFTSDPTAGDNPSAVFTKTGASTGEYVNPETAKADYGNLVTEGTGAYIISHSAVSGDAAKLNVRFAEPLKMDAFKEIRVYFYVNAGFHFGRIMCQNAAGDYSDNAGDATHPNGYIWVQGNAGFYNFVMPNSGKLATPDAAFTEVANVEFNINCYPEAKSVCVIDKITYISTDSAVSLRK